MSAEQPSLEVRNLVKHFPILGGLLQRQVGAVRAVDGVSFSLKRGETLGVVGESGCGKSTVGKTVLKLLEPTSGEILLGGTDVTHLSQGKMWEHRRRIQTVFQDPYSSMNPRLRAGTIVGEPLENYGIARGREKDERVAQLFQRVGLRPENMRKYTHEFSGGQRQRLGIAKALSVNPDVIVADEPVSALDVSVQAQVLNLLIDLQEEYRLAYLFISHDLAVMRHISHRIAVMYLGRVVELTDKRTLFTRPLHPYTEALLSAAPIPDPKKKRASRLILQGDVPSPAKPPSGCHFHTRCPYVIPECRQIDPVLMEVAPGQQVACIRRPVGAEPVPLTPTV
ncbi:ABC transporter ATP-binding protein [Oceanibaculum indicum]|uniref:Peptide/nickel transport system ATP-binding protein/oligopeptide transport system ATP-binding protein n=1 Tax=Oceanibaculum indicum TaxID=526216 RepID=A0A420WPB8_9PROT|nr:dipeptide ABC transporter ATP-binding protein [Oceanibaculum indicum]RKQ72891.1 peptide/nickel transport system ATP-binding protein/oligopeptide transport system ATP-binding protein [Oceanibaculum indicum]